MMLAAAISTSVTARATDGATMTPDPSVIALEIVPVCSDATLGQSIWKVTNKNSAAVHVDWNNFENSLNGGYDATPGVTELRTGFVASDPNNTTKFIYSGNVSQTNARHEACDDEGDQTPTPADCIDGKIQQNLVINWTSDGSVNVTTRDHMPLCEDVTIYLSSYTMPDNYNGQAFEGNVTAYPQPIFDSTSVTLQKGTDGTSDLYVNLPEACKNVQIDVYYGPEITTVGENGHGTQNIESKVYLAEGKCFYEGQRGNGGGSTGENGGGSTPVTPTTPVVPAQPGNGGGVETPAAPAPVAEQPTMPASLPETGSSMFGMTVPVIAALLTYIGMYAVARRRS